LNNLSFHHSILREYDIRGVVGETLFEKDAYQVGRCFGHKIKQASGKAVAVCRDGRLSSPQLEEALIKGLCEVGIDVYRLGVGPTPLLYFAEYAQPVDGAIMVTGSHNPPTHNGFKMSLGKRPFFGEMIQEFSQLKVEDLNLDHGKIYDTNLIPSYIKRVFQDLEFKKDLKIAWDPGHGATANVLKSLLSLLPGQHTLINCEVDGTFPAHSPDTSDPTNLIELQQIVIENQCDVGIAFDGDGDRLVVFDGKGRILWGDQLLFLFARDLLKRDPQATIIADVKVSQEFFNEINDLGGNAIIWKTGHSNIKVKMAESGARLAGEMSGHFFFKEDYYGFDDGIYAALKLLQILSQSSLTLSELYETLPSVFSTAETRFPCVANRKFKIPQEIKSRLALEGYSFIDIDGIRVQRKDGWWLVRASHTEDVLVTRCEAFTAEGLEHVKEHLRSELVKSQVFQEVEGF
jgi:phosphomannomutase